MNGENPVKEKTNEMKKRRIIEMKKFISNDFKL